MVEMTEWFLPWLWATLAVFALAQLVTQHDGPFDLLLRFRRAVGVYDQEYYTAPDGDQLWRPKGTLGRLFWCPYCLGSWLAIIGGVWLVWQLATGLEWLPALWLAVNGGQILLQRFSDLAAAIDKRE